MLSSPGLDHLHTWIIASTLSGRAFDGVSKQSAEGCRRLPSLPIKCKLWLIASASYLLVSVAGNGGEVNPVPSLPASSSACSVPRMVMVWRAWNHHRLSISEELSALPSSGLCLWSGNSAQTQAIRTLCSLLLPRPLSTSFVALRLVTGSLRHM